MTTTVDLSRIPLPAAIEAITYEARLDAFIGRFVTAWDTLRVLRPELPLYDVETLETDPAVVVLEAAAFMSTLDRQRVNDAVKAVLLPTATGTDLDNIAALTGTQRLVITPAVGATPAVMESDDRLRLRALLSWDRPAAGSADGYLFDAYTALPVLLHAKVNGAAIHGRRGDVDVVLIGPGGRLLTEIELTTVRTAVLAPNRKPEAVSVSVINATRRVWNASLRLEVTRGPDASLIMAEADARIRAMAALRTVVGGELPAEAVIGAAYGPNVLRVIEVAPVPDLAPEPYGVPVLGTLTLTTEVRN